MPPTAFTLTPALQNVVQYNYPFWPMVYLGQSVHRTSGQVTQEIVLPPALDEEALKEKVDRGRLHLQRALECDADRVFQPGVAMKWLPDEGSIQYQVMLTDDDHPGLLWTVSDCSQDHHNLGCIKMDRDGRAEGDDGQPVRRDFDHILSVLESLEVVPDNPGGQRRTINSTVHPYGPTVRLEACQDREYTPPLRVRDNSNDLSRVQRTNSRIEAFYNVFDGAIFVTKLQSSKKAAKAMGNKPPRWWEPRHVIWYCWHALHTRLISPLRGDDMHHFPRFSPPGYVPDSTLTPVSGRLPSPDRANLNTYRLIDPYPESLVNMLYFLNYVSFSGEAIRGEDVAIIRACLASRQTDTLMAPLWGYHETFEVGDWAFYALLSTKVGEELVKMLAEHKWPQELGKRFIRSITVFAADCYMEKAPPVTGGTLIKWPVLLFEIAKFSGDASRRHQLESMYVDNRGKHKHNGYRWEFPRIGSIRIAANTSFLCPRVVLPSDVTYRGAGFPGNTIFSELYQGDQTKYL